MGILKAYVTLGNTVTLGNKANFPSPSVQGSLQFPKPCTCTVPVREISQMFRTWILFQSKIQHEFPCNLKNLSLKLP